MSAWSVGQETTSKNTLTTSSLHTQHSIVTSNDYGDRTRADPAPLIICLLLRQLVPGLPLYSNRYHRYKKKQSIYQLHESSATEQKDSHPRLTPL